MAHPHHREFQILDRIHDAEHGKLTLTRDDVDNFISLFIKDGKILTGDDLHKQIRFLNNIIKGAFSSLKHAELKHEITFVMMREANALNHSFRKSSKDRHIENLSILRPIAEVIRNPDLWQSDSSKRSNRLSR